MHICVDNLTIISSDNGLSPGRRQAIIWTNVGILLIEPLGTNFSEILIEIITFSVKKMHLKMSSGNWQPFCLGLNELMSGSTNPIDSWETNLVITMPVGALEPEGAKPSAATVMTEKLDIFVLKSCKFRHFYGPVTSSKMAMKIKKILNHFQVLNIHVKFCRTDNTWKISSNWTNWLIFNWTLRNEFQWNFKF